MSVPCNQATPTGPCQRPVTAPGSPCGVTHSSAGAAALVSSSVAPSAGPTPARTATLPMGGVILGSTVLDDTDLCVDCGSPRDLDGDGETGRCGNCADANYCLDHDDDRDNCGCQKLPTLAGTNRFELAGEDDDDLLRPPRFVEPSDLTPGMRVDLHLDHRGGWGDVEVVEVTPTHLVGNLGTGEWRRTESFEWSGIHAMSTVNDGQLRPEACLGHVGHGQDCKGRVEYRMSPSGGRSFPRCDKHWEAHLQRHANGDFYDGPIAPAWFDPTAAGERWDDDY